MCTFEEIRHRCMTLSAQFAMALSWMAHFQFKMPAQTMHFMMPAQPLHIQALLS